MSIRKQFLYSSYSHTYKNLIVILLATLSAVIIATPLPENTVNDWFLLLIAGIAISISMVPFLSVIDEFSRISKSLYLIFPIAYTLGFAHIFYINAGVFFINRFTLIQIYKRVETKANNKAFKKN